MYHTVVGSLRGHIGIGVKDLTSDGGPLAHILNLRGHVFLFLVTKRNIYIFIIR